MDLITRRLSAKDIGLPKWTVISKQLKEHGVKCEDAQLIRKGITPEDTKFKENERSSVDYITTKSVDRDGEIVVPNGAVLDHYRKHPVVLFSHDYGDIPIGKSLWIKADENGLISKTQYAKHSKADDIYQYRKDGFPMAKSIGFIPLEVVEEQDFNGLDLKSLGLEESDLKGASRIYPKWLMLEYSDVPVPSNPDALQLAISKGIIDTAGIKKAVDNNAFVFSEIEIVEPDPVDSIIEIVGSEKSEDIGTGETIVYKGSKVFESVKGADGPWNKSYKSLSINELDAKPSSVEYDIAAKWLDCRVRDIFVHRRMVPSAEMGSFLTGLGKTLEDFDRVSVRNLQSDGTESPLEYSVVQLTSKLSSDFLVSGIEFYEKKGEKKEKLMVKSRQTWYGFQITAYSSTANKEISMKMFHDAQVWADENNFLKGENFSLSGEFITKTDESWDSLLLSKKNETTVKRVSRFINEKGMDLPNRGMILMGPPGTGKTLSGRVLSNNSDVTFIWVSARDFVYSGAVGGINYAFGLAKKLAPSILFIEDIDNWLNARTCDLMKTEMDGISQSKGVVTMLTSNYPQRLPSALIDRPGRFHDVLNFELPDSSIRSRMLMAWAPGLKEKTATDIVSKTVGFSGAHMFELIEFAKTLLDELDIDLDAALVESLNKINEQRELITNIKKSEDELVPAGQFSELVSKSVYGEILEVKEGRVLSKKTKTIVEKAMASMSNACSELEKLISDSDLKETDEQTEIADEHIVEIENAPDDSAIETKDIPDEEDMIMFDSEELKTALTEVFRTALGDKMKANGSDIVREGLDKHSGKIF